MRLIPVGLLVAFCMSAQNSVGSALSLWTPGTLDIHQISTGRGNAALLILPDGTTVLMDAGGAGAGIPETEPHLAGAANPGSAIGRYIRRHSGATLLDYALITHFHSDHMGGIADAYKEVRFAKLLDRGWPDYSYPAPQAEPLAAYRAFLSTSGVAVERFRPGLAGQLALLWDAARYPDFEIRNIIATGSYGLAPAMPHGFFFPQSPHWKRRIGRARTRAASVFACNTAHFATSQAATYRGRPIRASPPGRHPRELWPRSWDRWTFWW